MIDIQTTTNSSSEISSHKEGVKSKPMERSPVSQKHKGRGKHKENAVLAIFSKTI